jgi:hypothetical protein
MTLKFEDRADASDIRITDDGYLVADVRCAKVGVQQYMASDVGLPGHGLVSVYRPESTVFNKDSLATFAGKPVTLKHPPELVNAENWKKYAVGDVGEDILRDGEFIRVPIKLMDAAAIEAVKNGTREISMGYSCDIKHEDGVTPEGQEYNAVQVGPIRINHLAIVDKARGGSKLRIGDSAIEKWGAIPINDSQRSEKGGLQMPEVTKPVVVLGDAAIQVDDAAARVLEKFKADTSKQLSDAKALADAKDEEIGTLKVELQKANDAANIDVDALVAARTELVAQVKAIDSAIEVAGKSDTALRKEAVAKKLGDAAIVDASDAEIKGMFKVLAKDAATTNPVQVAIQSGNFGDSKNVNDAHAAYLARLDRQSK